jgi:hypothetical protein
MSGVPDIGTSNAQIASTRLIRDKRAAPQHEGAKDQGPKRPTAPHHRPADKLLTCPRGWVLKWTVLGTRKPRVTENKLTNDRTPEPGRLLQVVLAAELYPAIADQP